MIALDVTDLVEFLQRHESVSGVQRVIAETMPILRSSLTSHGHDVSLVMLDRGRGAFVAVPSEVEALLITHGARSISTVDRATLAAASTAAVAAATSLPSVPLVDGDVLVFLGALWISDAEMLAARRAHSDGARIVALLYDLTPIMEAGHTAAVNRLFDRYLTLLLDIASRVPAISKSSRQDFEAFAAELGVLAPAGAATGLPCGLGPADVVSTDAPWSRPYALMVGTIEGRKNHLLALRVWQRLIEEYGPQNVPDLLCVGRLGWNATPFLRAMVRSHGLDGKVHLLSTGVNDADLAALYAHAQFTVYPSRYEGWGLPVSESLAFGVLPIVADNSSLREAGGDLAVYFRSDDEEDFRAAVVAHGLDPDASTRHRTRIRAADRPAITWHHVAEIIHAEIEAALREEARPAVVPTVEIGQEVVLSPPSPAPDAGHADKVYAHLIDHELTPLLRQPRGDRDDVIADAALIGEFGSPQAWGLEVRPGRRITFSIRRQTESGLVALFSTRSMPGRVVVQISGSGGDQRTTLYLGSVLEVPLGSGPIGSRAQASVTVVDAHDSIEGFLGLRSFVVLRADDREAATIALRSANAALRDEIDFITNSRSWRLTQPLRRWKGRGSS